MMRPVNCLMMGLAVIIGAVLASQNATTTWFNLSYGFVTGFMLTGASMAINDFHDREIDAINEPNRPIPSGLIKPKQALAYALLLTAIGFIAAFLTNLICLALAIIAWAVFVTYTTVGKRSGLPGNFLVSTCVAIPFLYGSVATLNTINLSVSVFASIAFLSNTGREITKGIADVQGDKTKRIQTLAVRFGDKTAAVAAALFYLMTVILSPIPWLLNVVSVWFIPLVAITDVGLVISSAMLLKNYSRENARRIKKLVLLWLLIALLAIIVGTIR